MTSGHEGYLPEVNIKAKILYAGNFHPNVKIQRAG